MPRMSDSKSDTKAPRSSAVNTRASSVGRRHRTQHGFAMLCSSRRKQSEKGLDRRLAAGAPKLWNYFAGASVGASFPVRKLPRTKKSPLHIQTPSIFDQRNKMAKVKGLVFPSVGVTLKSVQSQPALPLT